MNHEEHCKHDLAHCEHCDAIWCRNCKKEWGAPCALSHYPTTITYPVYPILQPAPTWNPYQPMWGTITVAGGQTDILDTTTNVVTDDNYTWTHSSIAGVLS